MIVPSFKSRIRQKRGRRRLTYHGGAVIVLNKWRQLKKRLQ